MSTVAMSSRLCARPGCRKPKVESQGYCRFHWAEYQREWRKAHPLTAAQARAARDRARKSRGVRNGTYVMEHDCRDCHFYDRTTGVCEKHRAYRTLKNFPFAATHCRDFSPRFVVLPEQMVPIPVTNETKPFQRLRQLFGFTKQD